MMFVIPGTRDLVGDALKMPCSMALPGIRQEADGWFNMSGHVTVHQSLKFINASQEEVPIISHSSDLTHGQTDAQLLSGTLALNSLELWCLKRQVNHLVNFTSSLDVNPEQFKQTMEDIGNGLRDVNGLSLQRLQMAVTGIAGGSHGLFTLLMSKITHAITTTILWGFLVLLIGGLLYGCVQYCRILRCLQCCGRICECCCRYLCWEATPTPAARYMAAGQHAEVIPRRSTRPRTRIYAIQEQGPQSTGQLFVWAKLTPTKNGLPCWTLVRQFP